MMTLAGRPAWRGRVHTWAFFAALPVGLLLVATAQPGAPRAAVALYALSAAALLGVSGLYHRRTWSPAGRRRMRRLDHSMIFVALAGSYTPWAVIVLQGATTDAVLGLLWAGAAGGVVVRLAWLDAPRTAVAATYVVVGLVALAALPTFLSQLGPVGTGLVAGAGALATLGALVYATRRPDPLPTTFGYHEVFHVLVVAAFAAHTLAVALYAA